MRVRCSCFVVQYKLAADGSWLCRVVVCDCVIDRHHSGYRDWRRSRLTVRVRPPRRHTLVQEV